MEGNKVEPGVGQAQGGQDEVKVSGFDRDLKLQVHTVCVPTAAAMEGNKVEPGVGQAQGGQFVICIILFIKLNIEIS